jgi:hypothetical protein
MEQRSRRFVTSLCSRKHLNGLDEAFWAYNYLSLLGHERKPKTWERHLLDEVIAQASEIGFSQSVSAGRKLNMVLTAADEARSAPKADGYDRLPLPRGYEEAWVSVAASRLELPETVPSGDFTVDQLVAMEIGERALDEAVMRAITVFHESVVDFDAGYSQILNAPRSFTPDARLLQPFPRCEAVAL